MAYVALAVELHRLGGVERPDGYLAVYLQLVLAWGIGSWLRSTRVTETEHRRHLAEATRTAERTRIARELHDVVTHHVTAMVVQAEAARYLTAAPARLEATLSAVTDTGRRAITDLRHLLDLLNPDHDTDFRTPAVGELHTLVEHALKYAHGSLTVVRVRYGEREITVEVGTDGPGSQTGSVGGSGRGLAGLRERAEALGGEFSADRQAGGGFIVRARIPAGNPS